MNRKKSFALRFVGSLLAVCFVALTTACSTPDTTSTPPSVVTPSTSPSSTVPPPPSSTNESSSQPASAAPATADMFTSPQLTLSQGEKWFDFWEWGFISDEGVFAGTFEQDGNAVVRVSADSGATWNEAPYPETAKGRSEISMASPLEGMLVSYDTAAFHAHTTRDGGKTWALAGSFTGALPYDYFELRTISPDVAFVTTAFFPYGLSNEDVVPAIYETTDGGKTWEMKTLALPREIAALSSYAMQSPTYLDNRWNVYVSLRQQDHYTKLIYTRTQDGWVWDTSGWSLPEGISAFTLADYLSNADIWVSYSPGAVEDKNEYYRLTSYLYRYADAVAPGETHQNQSGDRVMSAELVEGYAEYVFGDAEVDARTLNFYDEASGEMLVPPHEAGMPWKNIFSFERVTTTETGDIDIIWLRGDGTEGDSVYNLEPYRQHIVLRPVMVNGVQLFTLLLAEKL